MFLLDDGWFGNKHPRNSDNAGLGDWEAMKSKLPGGIPALVKSAKEAGVKFGIWIEPEMVNPKSELFEKHPDPGLSPCRTARLITIVTNWFSTSATRKCRISCSA